MIMENVTSLLTAGKILKIYFKSQFHFILCLIFYSKQNTENDRISKFIKTKPLIIGGYCNEFDFNCILFYFEFVQK